MYLGSWGKGSAADKALLENDGKTETGDEEKENKQCLSPHPLHLPFLCGGAQRPTVIPFLPQQIYFRWISTTEK